MSSRSPELSLSPFSSPLAIADYMSALSLCCAYARDAASEGRFRAAHGLFQTAIYNFDSAQKVAQRADQSSFHDWSLHGQAENPLTTARAELDECAMHIYPTDPQ